MKVVFVNAVSKFKYGDLYIGSLILAKILKKNGYEVEIVDFAYLHNIGELDSDVFENGNTAELSEYLINKKADIISFYTMANSYHLSIDMAEYIRSNAPDIKLLFGGPQASVAAYDLMNTFPFIDLIGIGEGENSIVDIMKAFEGEKDFSKIKGICYRKGTEIITNEENGLIQDLDTLPEIDYELIPYMDKMKSLPIEVGRGCPFGCKYCSSKSFWKQKFRLKSNDRIISEIKSLMKEYNITHFSFIHDLFTANKKRIIEFCNKIIEEELKIKWACSARIDTLDNEIIEMLVRAGCTGIYIGVETGSSRMQKFINKNLKINDDFYNKIKLLTKNKIQVTASFIYGLPNEELEDLKETFKVIKNLRDMNVHTVQLHMFSILRGTEFYNEYSHDMSFDDNLVSDITYGANMKRNTELITKYPNLFSHFYILNKSLVKKYPYCDMFMNHYIQILYTMFRITYNNLIDYFKCDFLAFYNSFYKYLAANSKELINYSDNIDVEHKHFVYKVIDIWKEYINSYKFEKYDNIIKEIYRFECDLNDFIFNNEENEDAIKTYDFDVYDANKKTFKLDEYMPKETIIRIYKPDGVYKLQRLRKKIS
ncbi:B12-binding domain-containing radical SAM protein [Abyssisolibacter fermentans]|uniref:B12-binding domain-containing radical SAM protein n=1 Tax=Abyssisolibacter fermentans TaxID=1766203 RepID=UPI0008362BAC|nr:radical SAM protein [Abyssisolibacter fermentans]